jgi:hypothetical protein
MEIAAGEYGYDLVYFRRMLEAARSTCCRQTPHGVRASPDSFRSVRSATRLESRSPRTPRRRCMWRPAARSAACAISSSFTIAPGSNEQHTETGGDARPDHVTCYASDRMAELNRLRRRVHCCDQPTELPGGAARTRRRSPRLRVDAGGAHARDVLSSGRSSFTPPAANQSMTSLA